MGGLVGGWAGGWVGGSGLAGHVPSPALLGLLTSL